MNQQPLVTIITPSLNQGEFLEETILSVLDQDYPAIEYMVIDGGSTDHSVPIIQKYADRLAYWETKADRGQAHAINKGLQRAKGQFLGWLNADDRLLPGTITTVVDNFRQNRGVDVVYGRLRRINKAGLSIPTPLLPKDKVEFDKNHAIGECVVNQPGAIWRRSIMEQVGYLDESLHYVLDYEYWVRILLAGGNFKRLTRLMAEFRLSQGSKTSSQAAKMAEEHLMLINRLASQADLAQKLGISPQALERQVRKGRGLVSLYAFYGCVREKRWQEAWKWFSVAQRADPAVLFSRRWLDLAMSGANRRISG